MSFAVDADIPAGKLRIGGVESLCTAILPQILLEFYRVCPQVEIIVISAKTNELIDMIKCNDIDLLFTFDQVTYGSEWIRPVKQEEEIVFVTSSCHSITNGEKVDLQTIIHEPFILTEKGNYRYELEKLLAEQELYIRPVLEIGNTETIIHLLEEGMGVSFLPLFAVEKSIEKGSLYRIQTDIPTIQMWSQLLYHRNKWVSPQMQLFITMMQDFFKKRSGNSIPC
jgi:DNA-binding transcriptional LysR family regulator